MWFGVSAIWVSITSYAKKQPFETLQRSYEEQSSSHKKIHGWLTFFLVAMGLMIALSSIFSIKDWPTLEFFDSGHGYNMSLLGAVSNAIMVIGVIILGVYTIFSFYNYKSNAITLGKSFIVIFFVMNLLKIFESISLAKLIGGLMWCVICVSWFLYLTYSKQVKTLFPKEERKLFRRDKLLLFSIVTPVIIWVLSTFVISISQALVGK